MNDDQKYQTPMRHPPPTKTMGLGWAIAFQTPALALGILLAVGVISNLVSANNKIPDFKLWSLFLSSILCIPGGLIIPKASMRFLSASPGKGVWVIGTLAGIAWSFISTLSAQAGAGLGFFAFTPGGSTFTLREHFGHAAIVAIQQFPIWFVVLVPITTLFVRKFSRQDTNNHYS